MSEQDDRLKRRGQVLKYFAIGAASFAGVVLFVGGVVFGIWFSQNFQVVPRGHLEEVVSKTLASNNDLQKMLTQPNPNVEEIARKVLESQAAPPAEQAGKQSPPSAQAPASDAASQGAFTFKFKPGEKLQYRLAATMNGKGFEALSPEPIALNLDSAFNLTTESVDAAGNGTVQLKFDGTRMDGNFMGSPFKLSQGPRGANMQMDGKTYLDTAQPGQSTAGIPQLEFLNTPVRMLIAPNGVVKNVSGSPGMDNMVDPMSFMTNLEFPSGPIDEGTQWVSYINMPVPGIGTPVRARVLNTFRGYKTVGKRLCAVIDQKIDSEQSNGVVTSPQSLLGQAMGFTMPEFKLNGGNTVYFDTENGQLVHSEMGLNLNLDIGRSLGGDVLKQLGSGLGSLLGDLPEYKDMLPQPDKKPGAKQQENLLDLNLGINATVSLTDPVAPAQ